MEKRRVCVLLDRTACLRRSLDARTLVDKYIDREAIDVVDEAELDTADAVIVVTCGFNGEARASSLEAVARAQMAVPSESIMILGCLPGTNPELISSKIRWAIAPKNYTDVEAAMDALAIPTRQGHTFVQQATGLAGLRSHGMAVAPSTYYLKVADGCTGHCGFCGIKSAIGDLRSRSIEDIGVEAVEAVAQGATAFYPASDDLGAYGTDRGSSLPELLRVLLAAGPDGGREITIDLRNVIHPVWLVRYQDGLCELAKEHPGVFPAVSLAIQSWDRETLKRCGRYSNVGRIRRAIGELRRAAPEMYVMAHIVVGLPGTNSTDVRGLVDRLLDGTVDFWTCMKYYQHERSPFVREGVLRSEGEVDELWGQFVAEVTGRGVFTSDATSAYRIYVAARVDVALVNVPMRRAGDRGQAPRHVGLGVRPRS